MTGAETFTALRSIYGTASRMNVAIGAEWRARGYQGLRLAAAEALLTKHRVYVGDAYDANTLSYDRVRAA